MKKLLWLLITISNLAFSQICTEWENGQTLGYLDHSIINEASGIAVSTQFKNRLYHINDSGDGPFFYQTNLEGKNTKKIRIKGFLPFDVESMAYGKCEDSNCIVIADIGDNYELRKTISFVIIKEEKTFKKKVTPKVIIKAAYPDKAHNVEGVALHPNGNIYILTKEVNSSTKKAQPSEIFVLTKEQQKDDVIQVKKLTKLGSIDLPFYLKDYDVWGKIVTGLDISPNGKKLLITTYKVAVEIDLDLSTTPLPDLHRLIKGTDYSIYSLDPLRQIEAISYFKDDSSFLYTTEYHKSQGPSPIMKVNCRK